MHVGNGSAKLNGVPMKRPEKAVLVGLSLIEKSMRAGCKGSAIEPGQNQL